MQGTIELNEADIRAALAKVELAVAGMTQEQVADRVTGLLTGELRLMDCQGLTDEAMEGVYALAYNTFRAGKFENAHKLFMFLAVYDHLTQKYWMGLGACRYNLGYYDMALEAYGMAQVIDPADPRPQLRGAECCLALNHRESAIAALRAYLFMAGESPKEAANVKRARALLAALDKPAVKAAQAR
jgi:type III secretion system low calcium response chaperone LcrH/SycD